VVIINNHIKNSKKYQAIAAGHLCLDIFPGFTGIKNKPVTEIFSPGKLTQIKDAELSVGGAATNTGLVLNRLGISTMLMGKIGNDYFGRVLCEIIKKWGSDTTKIAVSDELSTSYSIMLAIPGMDKIALHSPGTNDFFSAEDIDYSELSNVRLFHFGYPVLMKNLFKNDGEEMLKILQNVKNQNVTTSLDMAPVDPASDAGKADWKKILKKILPFVDFYLPSLEETIFMLRNELYNELLCRYPGQDMLEVVDLNILQELGEELAGLGTKTVVLKCGYKGAYVLTSDKNRMEKAGLAAPADIINWSSRELFQNAYQQEKIISTTGCGDSFIAGFLASLLTGEFLENSLRIACACGAEATSVSDNISGVRSIEEIKEKILNGWPVQKFQFNGNYWSYSSREMLWKGKKDSSNLTS